MNEHTNSPFRGPGGPGGNILIIDNYDSFTYNLVHLVNELGLQCDVWRNDKFALEDVDAYDKIILSPGPGIPSEAGLLLDVIKKYAPTKSIFGVCLGQQAIAEVFGGSLYNLSQPMHGIATPIKVTDTDEQLFRDLPDSFKVGRYHSWVVSANDLPEVLKVTAIDEEDNSIMALSHREYDVRGVQFHPESILTEYGKEMMGNWLK
ncbi:MULTISPECIES: aminodeoxychorismate/anthranilate synthase component II [unclassified Mucilaginibacter]|jgi:anthranilate synthase component 2|uniref:anthranilate synthase component II n=1 Tax=unclassified Mucilaginibacter TaxID=2617802 RepID=UPI0008B43B45|nr:MULTISPECIES: aminodeoxychorismate/anthranilate synthase component II [unclassified Mucilaginibacter]WDF77468.1 aminodeoxychorismate/anthranilate synthase component II [Mucilaginibacter sp. KACC 22773]SEO17190.1 anthranilate synthase component 2 [Mucilaginibacter sp. OK283]